MSVCVVLWEGEMGAVRGQERDGGCVDVCVCVGMGGCR